MQKVKTLFIFTFMVVILYGAYLVLYKGPAPTPQEVVDHLANGGGDELELDLGEQITADELLAGITDQFPIEDEDDNITAADNGEFVSPAAAALSDPTVSVEGLTDPAELPVPLQTQPTDVAPPLTILENPNDPRISTAPEQTNTAGDLDDRGGSFQLNPTVEPASIRISDEPASVTQDDPNVTSFPITDHGGQGETAPPSFSGSPPLPSTATDSQSSQTPVFTRAWLTAQQQIETGHLREALLALSVYYRSPELSAAQHQQLLPVLDYLAGEVVYSRKHFMAPAYTVGVNESIDSIAHQYRIPVMLLANINGLKPSESVQPGDEIKVLRGPFRGEINLGAKELTLFVGHLYAGRFQIQTGSDFSANLGKFTILDKQTDRSYSAADGSVIPGGHGSNPFGHHWMGLGGNISIHGTAGNPLARQNAGSISLSPIDARDVYSILSAGSQIVIQR